MIFKNIFKKTKSITALEEPQPETNRLKELKQLKKLANNYLNFYLKRQKSTEKDWEKELSDRNIALLKSSINKINKLKHNEKIAEYLEAKRPLRPLSPDSNEEDKKKVIKKQLENFSVVFSQGTSLFLLMEINKCSPKLSYTNDLTWFKHGSIREHLDYGFGKVDETVFEKYLPYQIDQINETKKTFFSKDIYKDDLILVEAMLPLIEKGAFIPANILIITLIEGLVRKFSTQVFKKQNFNYSKEEVDNFIYHDFSNLSLEKLIRNKMWKKDIPISFASFLVKYSHASSQAISEFESKYKKHKDANDRIVEIHIAFQKLISGHLERPAIIDEEFKEIISKYLDELKAEGQNLMNEDEKAVLIGIDIYLDFLVKQFKEERNYIIHGKYSFFKEKWKSLVYLSTLQTLIEKIMWYDSNILNPHLIH